MRRPRLVLVVACCALVAACSGTATTGQGGTDGNGSGASAGRPDPGSAEATALDFTVPAVDGSTFRGADYGGDALAIWFWAPW